MSVKTRPIGDKFDFPMVGTLVVCPEICDCHGCVFRGSPYCDDDRRVEITGACCKDRRTDKRNVMFEMS